MAEVGVPLEENIDSEIHSIHAFPLRKIILFVYFLFLVVSGGTWFYFESIPREKLVGIPHVNALVKFKNVMFVVHSCQSWISEPPNVSELVEKVSFRPMEDVNGIIQRTLENEIKFKYVDSDQVEKWAMIDSLSVKEFVDNEMPVFDSIFHHVFVVVSTTCNLEKLHGTWKDIGRIHILDQSSSSKVDLANIQIPFVSPLVKLSDVYKFLVFYDYENPVQCNYNVSRDLILSFCSLFNLDCEVQTQIRYRKGSLKTEFSEKELKILVSNIENVGFIDLDVIVSCESNSMWQALRDYFGIGVGPNEAFEVDAVVLNQIDTYVHEAASNLASFQSIISESSYSVNLELATLFEDTIKLLLAGCNDINGHRVSSGLELIKQAYKQSEDILYHYSINPKPYFILKYYLAVMASFFVPVISPFIGSLFRHIKSLKNSRKIKHE